MAPKCISRVSDLKIEYSDENNYIINTKIEMFVKELNDKKQSIYYYEIYRNVSPSKAANDMFLGKKSEFFTTLGLWKCYGFPWLNPDLRIYSPEDKGWDADLPYHETYPEFPNVHVKGCDYQTCNFCHDFSWTFQYSNNTGFGGRDTIFNKVGGSDLVSFVFIDQAQEKDATIKLILPWHSIKKYLKDPIKPSLKGQKKCIYYQDLLNNKEIING